MGHANDVSVSPTSTQRSPASVSAEVLRGRSGLGGAEEESEDCRGTPLDILELKICVAPRIEPPNCREFSTTRAHVITVTMETAKH